jgi:hypothetical protein
MNKKKHLPHDNLKGVIQSLIRTFRSGLLRSKPQDKRTEPAADNLGRGTATGPAEVRPSEHTHDNSNTPDANDQSILNWSLLNLADAYKERPPIEFVVGNIFPLPSLSVVYGSPGSFKSFLLADLACCVASGKDWLPPFGDPLGEGYPVTEGGAVWIDFDNGQLRTLDRFKALGSTMQLPEDVLLKIYSMPYPVFDARNQIQVIELQEMIALHEAKLVVLDNLAMISGNADENSADMAEIFNNLRQISEITRTAIVVIHHPRKGSQPQGRAGDRLRGHSSIEAAIDLALYMERSGDHLSVEIKPTKARDSMVKPFIARFAFELDKNEQLTNARFYSTTGSLNNQTVKVMAVIWDALADDDFNKGELTSRVKELLEGSDAENVGENRIGKTVTDMHEQGFLLMNKGKNNAQIFSRNPDKPYKRFSDGEGDSL